MATSGRAASSNPVERNQEATVYVGGLDEKVSEELLWELMVQAAPVKHVYVPRDRITGQTQGYGFCEFKNESDAEYATKVMNMVRLFGKPIRVQQSSVDKRWLDVGANLFIGNLDAEVDEKLIYDTFSAFGSIIEAPYIMRDPDNGQSKGFGFIKYDSFEASDAAIEAMSGQFLANRQIVVQYAYKKDSADGIRERHGTQAERLLAASSGARASGSGPQAPGVGPKPAGSSYPPRMPPPPQGQIAPQYGYPAPGGAVTAPAGLPPVGLPPGYHGTPVHAGYSASQIPPTMPPPPMGAAGAPRVGPMMTSAPVSMYGQQPPPNMPPPPLRAQGLPPNMPPPPTQR